MSDNFSCIAVHLHCHIENLAIEDTFTVPNLCKGRLLYFYIQIMLSKKDKKRNTFGIINRIKHFFLGNIVIYEALGQVILPLSLPALGQYHLPSGFINHDIAQKEVFYSVITGHDKI